MQRNNSDTQYNLHIWNSINMTKKSGLITAHHATCYYAT